MQKNQLPFFTAIGLSTNRRVKEKFVIATLCSESSGSLLKTLALKFKDVVAEEEEEEDGGKTGFCRVSGLLMRKGHITFDSGKQLPPQQGWSSG